MTFNKIRKAIEGEPSLEELQQKDERVTTELSIVEKQAMIKELEARGRKWEMYSINGKKDGINWQKIKAFLVGTKGVKKS